MRELDAIRKSRRARLNALGIPKSTYYDWRRRYAGQGKIERFHRSIKSRMCLIVYCSPDALKRGIDEVINNYTRTPHTALKNVSPWDVYAGRKDEILKKRAEKKALTMERRRLYNKALREHGR